MPGRRNMDQRNSLSSDTEDGQISSDDEEQGRRRLRRRKRHLSRASNNISRAPPVPNSLPLENISDSDDSVIILPAPTKAEPIPVFTLSDDEPETESKEPTDPDTDSTNAGDAQEDLEILQLRRNVLEVMLTRENTMGRVNVGVLAEDNYEEATMDVSPADGQELSEFSRTAQEGEGSRDGLIPTNLPIVPGIPTAASWRRRRPDSDSSDTSTPEPSWTNSIPLPPELPTGIRENAFLSHEQENPEPFRLRTTRFNPPPPPPLILPYDTDERQNPFLTNFGPLGPLPFFGSPFGPPPSVTSEANHPDLVPGTLLPINSFGFGDHSCLTSFGFVPGFGNGDIDMRLGNVAVPVPFLPPPPPSLHSPLSEYSFFLPPPPPDPVIGQTDIEEPKLDPPRDTNSSSAPNPPRPPLITFNIQPRPVGTSPPIPPAHPLFSPSPPSQPQSPKVLPLPELPTINQEQSTNVIAEISKPSVPSGPKIPPKPPTIRLAKLGTRAYSPDSSPERKRKRRSRIPISGSNGGKRPLVEHGTVERERGGKSEKSRTGADSTPPRPSRRPRTAPVRKRSQSPPSDRYRSRSRSSRRRLSSTNRGMYPSHSGRTTEKEKCSSRKATSTSKDVGEKGVKGSVLPTEASTAAGRGHTAPLATKGPIPLPLPPIPVNLSPVPPNGQGPTTEPSRVRFIQSPPTDLDDEDELRAKLLIDVSKTRLGLLPSSAEEPPNIVVKISQDTRNEQSGGNKPISTRSVYQSTIPSDIQIRNEGVSPNQRFPFPPFKKTIYNHSAFQTKPNYSGGYHQNPFQVTTSKPIRPIIINVRGGETSSDDSDPPSSAGRTVTFLSKKTPSPIPSPVRSVQVKRNKESGRKVVEVSPTKPGLTNGIVKPPANSSPIPANVAASFEMFIADARKAALAKRNKENESRENLQAQDLIPPAVKHLSLAAQAEYTELVGRIHQKTAERESVKAKQSPPTSPQKRRQTSQGTCHPAMSPVHPRVRVIKGSIPSPIHSFSGEKPSAPRTPSPTKESAHDNVFEKPTEEVYDISVTGTSPTANVDDSFGSDVMYGGFMEACVVDPQSPLTINSGPNLDSSIISLESDRLVIDEHIQPHTSFVSLDSDSLSVPEDVQPHNTSFSSRDSDRLVIDDTVQTRDDEESEVIHPPPCEREVMEVVGFSVIQDSNPLITDEPEPGRAQYLKMSPGSLYQKRGESIPSQDSDQDVIGHSDSAVACQHYDKTVKEDDCATGSAIDQPDDREDIEKETNVFVAENDDNQERIGIFESPKSKDDFYATGHGDRRIVEKDMGHEENAEGWSTLPLDVSKIISPPVSDEEIDITLPFPSSDWLPDGIRMNDEESDRFDGNQVETAPLPTVIPFAAVNVLFPSVETSAQEQKHKELVLRERLLKSTLRRRVENSELQLNLRNAEGQLVDKRLQCISKLEGLNEKLKKLSGVKLRRTKLQEDRHFYLRQLAKVEQELDVSGRRADKLETVVRARTSSLLVDQADYVHLTESCIEFGGKLSGIRYLLPNTSLGDYERKYAEAQKQLAKVKLSINLPKNPKIREPPPALPSTSTTTTSGSTLLPTQRLRHTPFTLHSYIEDDSEAEVEAGNETEPRYQLPPGRLRGYLTGDGEGTNDEFLPYVSPVTGKVLGETGIQADPSSMPPSLLVVPAIPDSLPERSLTIERACIVPNVPQQDVPDLHFLPFQSDLNSNVGGVSVQDVDEKMNEVAEVKEDMENMDESEVEEEMENLEESEVKDEMEGSDVKDEMEGTEVKDEMEGSEVKYEKEGSEVKDEMENTAESEVKEEMEESEVEENFEKTGDSQMENSGKWENARESCIQM